MDLRILVRIAVFIDSIDILNLSYYLGIQEHFDPLRECLRSLAFPEMNSRSLDIDAAAEGTCGWLLRHQAFKSWASCDRGLLWIKGKPGSGKSTLLRYVLEHAIEIPNTGEGALILSFFFHGRGSELQKTPLGLFRSLLHQLLRQVPEALTDLMATFQKWCESVGKAGEQWQWHIRELQRFFESSFLKILETCPLWLFVDALDECGEENAVELAEWFKSLLERPLSSGLKQSRICFTCRHYPILYLDRVFEICAEEENRKDISIFVQDKLSSFRIRTSSTIPKLVTKRADGIFLWAWLVVKQVLGLERKGAGLKELEAIILSVPQELDILYRQLIQSMNPDSLKLMQWICFAMRPLSLDELRWAMLVDADYPHQSLYECQSAGHYPSDNDVLKRRIQTLSRGLTEITSDRKVVQFIHQSVKDFFVEKGLSALDETINPDFIVEIAHYRLSRICIRYLAMEEIGRSTSHDAYYLASEFPLLLYAVTSWVAHVKQSDASSVPQEDLLEYFTGPSNTLMERWVHIYRILDKFSKDWLPEDTSLIHILSRFGVSRALGGILGRADQVGIDINAKDGRSWTPLKWAAKGGHEIVVRLLLDRGAHIDAADNTGWTPLMWAAARPTQMAHEFKAWDTVQASNARSSYHIQLMFLERQNKKRLMMAHPEQGAGDKTYPWAAEKEHEAVVRLLLDRGAFVDAVDARGRTPLSYAAQRGYDAVVWLLLEWGACTEVADNSWGQTPLSLAAEKGDEVVVRLLLDRDANTETADKWGQTPLSLAAEKGNEAVVRLLLKWGACIEVADNLWGQTPLSRAVANGHEAIVWLLQLHAAQHSSTASP
jgi:ankyrin repeat protein